MSDRDDGPVDDGPDHDTPALVPDEVSGAGEPVEDEPRRRPDRTPMWAMVAGLVGLWFAVTVPVLTLVLAPLGIALGQRVLKRLGPDGGTKSSRVQAWIGIVAGTIAAVVVVLFILYFQLFFEWKKDVPAVEPKGEAPSETSTTTTTEPPG